MLRALQDESKASSNYLSSVGGRCSQANITEDDLLACMGKLSHNSTSESVHAISMDALVNDGMISFNHDVGQGWCNSNHVIFRNIDTLIGCSNESQ